MSLLRQIKEGARGLAAIIVLGSKQAQISLITVKQARGLQWTRQPQRLGRHNPHPRRRRSGTSLVLHPKMLPLGIGRRKDCILACLTVLSLISSTSGFEFWWPFPKKRFTKNSLIDAGSLGLSGDVRVVAFGDFDGDQL